MFTLDNVDQAANDYSKFSEEVVLPAITKLIADKVGNDPVEQTGLTGIVATDLILQIVRNDPHFFPAVAELVNETMQVAVIETLVAHAKSVADAA